MPTELEGKTHLQWFYFRSTSSSANVIRYTIRNAGDVSFPKAWTGYQVCASTDRKTWTRVASTHYDADTGALSWDFDHAQSHSVYFAYFDPYSYERHLEFVSRCAAVGPAARVRSLGQTLDGRELDVVEVGEGPLDVWVIHRQHPGESMASFFAEGLLERLLGLPGGAADGLATQLRRACTFHIVPHMNPDGATRGHLRTNACGANLNREWATTGDYEAPTLARSPEVYHVLAAMDAMGCDAFIDVHGDETLPVAFLAGAEGCDVWGARIEALQAAFAAAYSRANPDMQTAYGYEPDAPRGANYAICSNQIAQRFDCLAVTLEMPFKDNAANLDGGEGGATFQGARAAALGGSLLDALAYVAPSLRGVAAPEFAQPADAYVAPIESEEAVAAFVDAQYKACRGTAGP